MTLRRSVLIQHAAHTPLGNAQLTTDVLDGTPASGWA
jgi:hypothetical protein